jgi:triacylglycerol lipase
LLDDGGEAGKEQRPEQEGPGWQELARRQALPELVVPDRVPFDGCFMEPEDNPDRADELVNPVLERIRQDIVVDEENENKQKHPIVLVPGYMGTETYDFGVAHLDYWFGIPDAMAEAGFVQVFPAVIDAVGYSSDGPIEEALDFHDRIEPMEPGYIGRSAQLKEYVLDVLDLTGAPKVNLVAHSQGSLTARWLISNLDMADRVHTLVTLAGPHRGVPFTRWAIGEVEAPRWAYEPVERIMTWLFDAVSDSENPTTHGSHVEMWPEYTVNFFNPRCPDMDQVQYFSFAAQLVDIGGSHVSPYVLNPFWLLHELYATGVFRETGPNDGLVEITSAAGPFDGNDHWTFVGTVVGKKVLPGTGITSRHGIYWGIDHSAFMNAPMGATEYFHFDVKDFFVDVARMLNAYTQ